MFFTLSQKTYPSVSIFLVVRDSLQDNSLLLMKELTSYDRFTQKKYTGFFQGQHTQLKTFPTARYNDLSLGNSWSMVRIGCNVRVCKWLTFSISVNFIQLLKTLGMEFS